jgi:PhzF family phenazine biosynthesis protein
MLPTAPPRQRPFKQVDVFTNEAYFGNPLAVALDGTGLDETQMLRFANWTNLSETTFLLPPTPEGQASGADYRVRIFAPGGEMRFAGHPTLGSCHAWLEAGGLPHSSRRIVQECAAGLVAIERDGQRLAFQAPPLKRSAPAAMKLAQVAGALGLRSSQLVSAQMLDNGSAWLGILLDDAHTVLQLQPDHLALKGIGLKVGVAAFHPSLADAPALIGRSNREARAFGQRPAAPAPPLDDAEPVLEVRAFAAPKGILEDPVTGSLNAYLAQWLMADGHAPARYQAAQGTCLGRAGRVAIYSDADGQVWVGGDSVTCLDGTVLL